MTVSSAVAETIDVNDDDAVEVEIEVPVYTFAGLQIAPGPLYYNGTSYEIKDNWNYSSYNSVYGKNEGSTFFSFTDMGKLFEKSDYNSSVDGSIDNLLDPLDGWRLPTYEEWEKIIASNSGDKRRGSTVNGHSGSYWSPIKISDVAFGGANKPFGYLFFPDGKTLAGKELLGYNVILDFDSYTYYTTSLTQSELNVYLDKG